MKTRLHLIALLAAIAGCGGPPKSSAPAKPIGALLSIASPLGLPPIAIPADNPPTAETVALGKKLFFDTRLSSDNTVSCASCHKPDLWFADGQRVATGVRGQLGPRNAPCAVNAVFNTVQFWDGRAPTLEAQAGGPMANPKEMDLPHATAVERVAADPAYRDLFARAFGPGGITIDQIAKSIASFERTLVSGNSPFDRYQYGADKTAMNASAIRGLTIFKDKNRGNCEVCHTIGDKSALFSDGKFHNLGAGLNAEGELTDLGRYNETKQEADRGAFRTAMLRNVAQTAPYMHDGSQKTLKEVVDFYVGGGSANPNRDKEIKELKLSAQERADLVAFLEALTGDPVKVAP